MKIILFNILIILTSGAQALDVGFSRSSSSSSTSSSIKASHRFNEFHKLTLAYSQSKDTSGTVADDSASSIKASYRHKATDEMTLNLDLKSYDDFYFYDGFNGAGKISYKVFNIETENEETLNTTLNCKYEISRKNYSQLQSEVIFGRALSLGADQDFPFGISAGFDLSSYSYDTVGTLSRQALDNKTTANSDINTYTSYFPQRSVSVFAELNQDKFSVGFSQTTDTPLLSSGTSYTSTELFLDFSLTQDLSLSVSTTQGRSGGSSSTSRTTSFGFSAGF